MHVCIVDHEGQTKVHKNIDAHPDRFLPLIRPYRQGLVVAAECMFAWYWLADLCAQEEIPFVLGHALYMKAIHGGKAKNDKIDSRKIALLLKGGMLPIAYAYPKAMRATRDLLRRRTKLVHTRAEALAHIQNTVSQYNLPPLAKKLTFAANRAGVGWWADRRATMLQTGKAYESWHALEEAIAREGYVPENDGTKVKLRRLR
jgi:hypothetical protein